MRYRTFLAFNVLGGFLWAVGVTLLGYSLGDEIGADNIDKYLLPIIGVIIILSLTAVPPVPQAQARGVTRLQRRRPRSRAPSPDRRQVTAPGRSGRSKR